MEHSMSSSMEQLLLARGSGLWFFRRCRHDVAVSRCWANLWCGFDRFAAVLCHTGRLGWQLDRAFARLEPSEFFGRPGDSPERGAKIRQVDQRQQQSGDPEDMHMREERDQPQDGDDLELYFLAFVSHVLGQRMQSKV